MTHAERKFEDLTLPEQREAVRRLRQIVILLLRAQAAQTETQTAIVIAPRDRLLLS